jgi:hypothetical protein
MRPLHPLPPLEQAETEKKIKNGKKRTRVKDAPTRARRRTIDMTRWGSTHVKGIYLDNVVADTSDLSTAAMDSRQPRPATEETEETSSDEEQVSADEDDVSMDGIQDPPASSLALSSSTASPPPQPALCDNPAQNSSLASVDVSLRHEAQQTLSFLSTLFGESNQDWGGKEIIDEDATSRNRVPTLPIGATDDITEVEVVSRVVPAGVAMDEDEAEEESDTPDEGDIGTVEEAILATDGAPDNEPPATASKGLKDLFAPREEEGQLVVSQPPPPTCTNPPTSWLLSHGPPGHRSGPG